MDNRKLNIINNLRNKLDAIPVNDPLPNNDILKKYLTKGINDSIENSNQEYASHINNLKNYIDDWIEDNLKQVRDIVAGESKKRYIDFSEIENYTLPQVDLSSSFGMGFLGVIAGFFINPPAAIITGLIGFFGNLLGSAETRRNKRVAKTVNEAGKRYSDAFEKIQNTYTELIDENSDSIKNYVNDKLTFFFDDLNNQMEKFEDPISESEIDNYNSSFGKINEIRTLIKSHEDIIQEYYSIL